MTRNNKLFFFTFISILLIGGGFFFWIKASTERKNDLEVRGKGSEVDPLCNSGESFLAENCVEHISTKQIERPEWVELFPKADFYLIESRTTLNPETFVDTSAPNNHVIIEQEGQRYQAENFDKLLKVNQITINDENRELICRSFALITTANYLNQDLRFLPLEEANYIENKARQPFTYRLTVIIDNETKLNWYFVIKDGWMQTITYQDPTGIKDYFFNP